MAPPRHESQEVELDDYIRPFEEACGGSDEIDLRAYLPEAGHPFYDRVLLELVRIDLEHQWTIGKRPSVEDYQGPFPELFRDPESLRALTFEEYRLRRQAGEEPTPAEYVRRFGVDLTAGVVPRPTAAVDERAPTRRREQGTHVDLGRRLTSAHHFAGTAAAYLRWNRDQPGSESFTGGPSREALVESSEQAEFFDEMHRRDSIVAQRLACAVTSMPQVGDEFLGFHLLAELGAGSFGRAYLTRQDDLAKRLVVLKIAPNLFDEPHALAQLQHAHIAPVYSVHTTPAFQAVCMPFVGTTTLADLLKDLRKLPALPCSGKFIMDRLEARSQEWDTRAGFRRDQPTGSISGSERAPLANLSYVEGILWLAARVADGLAHAHGRGIIHKDLKPANILLTDHGQPMLLDFNLSEDNKLGSTASAARAGGTLPYMAPEQLAAIQFGGCRGDARTDIYGFGMVLYELLTGHEPVGRRSGKLNELVQEMLADRRQPPILRQANAAVSPGAESIVRHCLEPDPSRRYQTSLQLCEDLRRQLDHRPLRYAPDASRWERVSKWARRHPRWTSAAGVVVVATVLVMAVAAGLLARIGHLTKIKADQDALQARLTAAAARLELHEDLKSIEFLLGSNIQGAQSEQRSEGMALAERLVDRYQVLSAADWRVASLVAALPPEGRKQVRDDMGELLLLTAGQLAREGEFERAIRLNERAAGCFPQDDIPQVVWRQRTEIARLDGDLVLARQFAARAGETRAHRPRDRFLQLLMEYQRGARRPEDLSLMKDAVSQEKENFAVWLIMGNSYAELGNRDEAVECYDMAAALRPQSPWPSVYRGLGYLEQRRYHEANAAFDEVIRLKPDMREAYYNRALARFHLGDLAGSKADLSHLLSGPQPTIRAYLLRARVRSKQGDKAGALLDRDAALKVQPRDERDWTARGLERQAIDPRAALADYESALKINPNYPTALQNKSNVLAEDLGSTEEAIACLDKLLDLYPNYVPARAGRGVLRARLGEREGAHADARAALRDGTTLFNTYQVAGIYALSSKAFPVDRGEAFRLLSAALSQGFGLDLIDDDHDLDPIRKHPEFQQIVAKARRRPVGPTPSRATPEPKAQSHSPVQTKRGPVESSG